MQKLSHAVVVAIALLSACRLASATERVGRDDYAALAEHAYSPAGLAVPDGGLELRRDVASWHLESGRLYPQRPLSDGTVSGWIFEGEGRFSMAVPDPVELAQFRRSSGRSAAGRVDLAFSRLVLRTSEEGLLLVPGAGASAAGYESHKLAEERHHHWLKDRSYDADARVVYGRNVPGDRYLRVAMDTDELGWVAFVYDALSREELELTYYDKGRDFLETWISLDRREDRDPNGRPSRSVRTALDVEQVDVKVDLTAASRKISRVGYGNIQPRRAVFDVELRFVPRDDGARALALELEPWAEVLAIENEDGVELGFLRDHRGKRSSTLDSDLWDRGLVVLLERPLVAGEARTLRFRYRMDILNYVSGRGWYPGEANGLDDVHRGRIELTVLPKHDVRAMGEKVSETDDGSTKTSVWAIDRPAKMLTFSFAERFREETVEQEGAPKVIAFATSSGSSMRNKTYNVAADVSNSLRFFQQLLDDELPDDTLYATGIIGFHGQAFDGFLHLSEDSFEHESKGRSELFRAHEAAHQWWGHRVGWASYRDQWLSEAFAEYSAMMFVEAAVDDGRELYDEIVRAYAGLCLGELEEMSRFARGAFEPNPRLRKRIGPIDVGYRAATADTPSGYLLQAYHKGPLVLHMLRTMLRNLTKSDELFVEVLRDLVRAHSGGVASTDDFRAALERKAPGDWRWFFDQWIDGTDLPTYRYSWKASRAAGGKARVVLDVEQLGVPEGFRMPVPVELDFGGGRTGQVIVLIDEASESFTFDLPARPKRVELNPGMAVLAAVEQTRR